MESSSVFGTAPRVPKDAIFSLTAKYNDDQSSVKVNLGQGTYRDERGRPWVLPSVLEARSKIITSNLDHEYLPILGLSEFRRSACELALGSERFGAIQNRLLEATGLDSAANMVKPPPNLRISWV
ncbi:Aspartate aminotransferase, cytoplasmic [Exophiala sideris]|uniref:Aspartate aminotransferase, cytoplasmic n=1 Tax=Exophiala sideris TaxID=1016849 RepID=A0ABR0J0D9_9EURO|nr:Aspartate aminotransferase, cytoplasmic [Exophiala sideris]KAK5028655.1 Aspartate aminotransferase, cytoplasmic [Exophiala sideris]KAK5053033.1 Aspartate aminotransferase, cytoplasmic [Exophiala sideris]KAK5178773.1 Aspartate aminotransferase, cytoplasmic [Eurotiomycetes sp. CCFEE 6388]